MIFDPNPRLKNYELGRVQAYEWMDARKRLWRGGLYLPVRYTAGTRYPLVIQTHGFRDFEFEPSGMYPTAMAARSFAAAGFLVLQIDEDQCPSSTPEEAQCATQAYEGAVRQLSSEGIVDTDKIGIIGFSRTCLYVMHALTQGTIHFKAAAITSGVVGSYFQYLQSISDGDDGIASDAEGTIGSPPFGSGLARWLSESPTFNLHKIDTPLMITALGRSSVLSMWEPYAGLRRLNKPVDFVVLNSGEHVLTNPQLRRASQGGSIDWFRFWLQGAEDDNPSKQLQYARWRALRNAIAAEGNPQEN